LIKSAQKGHVEVALLLASKAGIPGGDPGGAPGAASSASHANQACGKLATIPFQLNKMFGHTGIDPDTVCYLGPHRPGVDRAGASEPDSTRRVTAVARRDPTCCAMTAVTLSELHEHGLGSGNFFVSTD
jgi:hypothetical protein